MTSLLGSLWQSIAPSNANASEQAEETTPKAEPQAIAHDVPTFELSNAEESLADQSQQDFQTSLSTSSSNAPSMRDAAKSPSTQTSNIPSEAAKSRSAVSSGSGLAPPKSGLMPPPRIPGPLPNRGPPANSQQRAGSNARGKVLLSPGHSPMDWAALTRSSNLSGVPSFQRVTPSQLKTMNGRKGKPIWTSYQGKVYNITPYMPFHPGGEKELFKSAGRDGTKLFMDIHPWVNWEGMLSACLVGILVSEEADGTLEDID